jgi:hypothetical protein
MLEVLYIYLVQREECSIRRRNQEMKRNLDPIHTTRKLVIFGGGGGGSHGHAEVLTHPHSVDTQLRNTYGKPSPVNVWPLRQEERSIRHLPASRFLTQFLTSRSLVHFTKTDQDIQLLQAQTPR